jgi:hypothetical protein
MNQEAQMTLSVKVTASELQSNGKFSIEFDVLRHADDGLVYKTATCTSPAHFNTTEEAFAAGKRAKAVFDSTGMFPNMCVPF